MLRICEFCKAQIGEKEPLEDKRETTSECDVCHPLNLERIQLQRELRKLSNSSLVLNSTAIKEISNKIDSINKILSFREYANETKQKIRFTENKCEVSCEDCVHFFKYNAKEKQCDIYGTAEIMDGDKICINFREEY